MTADEAIKILTDIRNFVEPGNFPEEHNAMKLGIEALKYIDRWHDRLIEEGFSPLPDETKD